MEPTRSRIIGSFVHTKVSITSSIAEATAAVGNLGERVRGGNP
jgi:hypothetical protein